MLSARSFNCDVLAVPSTWLTSRRRSGVPMTFQQLKSGGAGGARTHDRRIMSPLL